MFKFLNNKIKAIANIITKDSLDLLPIQEVRENYVINSDWNVVAMLTLNWFDKSLASNREIDAILVKHLDLLNTRLDWPISYTMIKRRSDLSEYRKTFNLYVDKSSSITDKTKNKIKVMAWMNAIKMAMNYDIPEKQYIIWLSYKISLWDNKLNLDWAVSYNTFNNISSKQWVKIKQVLDQKTNTIISMLNWWWINLWARSMKEDEIKTYFKNQIDSWINTEYSKKWKYCLN